MTNLILAIIPLLIQIESSGNDNARNEDCNGCLQIRPVLVEDVNIIYGTAYRHDECFSREVSLEICQLYLGYYCTKERLGHPPTMEDLARTWAAGPTGRRLGRATKYWKKVKVLLRAQEKT